MKNIRKEQETESLLPILSTIAEQYETKITNYTEKIRIQQEKIAQSGNKIDELTARIEKLEDTNRFLQTFAAQFPMVQALIDKNEARIQNIREVKIPKQQEKIEKRKAKIKNQERKLLHTQHKQQRCTFLSDVLKSFGILNPVERRQAFAAAMDRLNSCTIICMMDRVERLELKRETAKEHPKKYSALREKIMSIEHKIEKFQRAASIREQQSSTVQEVMDRVQEQIKTTSPEQAPVAAICESICEQSANIITKQTAEATEKPYIIPVKSKEQLEALKASGVQYTLKKKKDVDAIFALVAYKDKDAAKIAIASTVKSTSKHVL